MPHYLLSTYSVESDEPGEPMSPDEMQATMRRVATVEADMDSVGAFVFGGALASVDTATIVEADPHTQSIAMTDGPFAEAKEHIAGFYIVEAEDLDAALAWAGRVSDAVRHRIEVRPFHATGRVPG